MDYRLFRSCENPYWATLNCQERQSPVDWKTCFKAISLVIIGICVPASGCRPTIDSLTIWKEEVRSPDGLWIASVRTYFIPKLGITPEVRDDHAYLASWLAVLKQDKRAIFAAASPAQRAADYLRGLQPRFDPESA